MSALTKHIILLFLMLASAGGAVALRPTHKIADTGPKIELESIVPKHFGDWVEEVQTGALVVDPTQSEFINKIYSQTLTRTYKNTEGYRIMLSLAYGNDQSDSLQVHKPEVCYPAQGFELKALKEEQLTTPSGSIAVTRVNTVLGQRVEPITYWIMIGNQVVGRGSIQKKLVEIGYGLGGLIPDGMLIRISSIDPDIKNAYERHDQFALEMLTAIPAEYRERFSGKFN
jgi:EpsI family protein